MSNYLVTGGAGFIGTNIVRYLLKRGGQVRVIDNLSTGRRSNLRGVEKEVDFIEGDVRDRELMVEVCRGIDVVLHNAAWRAVGRSVDDPFGAHDTNCTGTLSVLGAAKENEVRRVVLASSAAVYGDQDVNLYSESLSPRPESPYAAVSYTHLTLPTN